MAGVAQERERRLAHLQAQLLLRRLLPVAVAAVQQRRHAGGVRPRRDGVVDTRRQPPAARVMAALECELQLELKRSFQAARVKPRRAIASGTREPRSVGLRVEFGVPRL
jgi:hypothetical protein